MIDQVWRVGTHQKVAYTGTAGTIANAIATGTDVVRVMCTTAAYIKISSSPTATTSDVYMPANEPELFVVTPGQKVSAVQVASGGNLHVTELSG